MVYFYFTKIVRGLTQKSCCLFSFYIFLSYTLYFQIKIIRLLNNLTYPLWHSETFQNREGSHTSNEKERRTVLQTISQEKFITFFFLMFMQVNKCKFYLMTQALQADIYKNITKIYMFTFRYEPDPRAGRTRTVSVLLPFNQTPPLVRKHTICACPLSQYFFSLLAITVSSLPVFVLLAVQFF